MFWQALSLVPQRFAEIIVFHQANKVLDYRVNGASERSFCP